MAYESIGTPNRETGEELIAFFRELLANGGDLANYYNRDTRTSVVDKWLKSDYAKRLLREGSLREIEENIVLVTGSAPHAQPLLIVWPPM